MNSVLARCLIQVCPKQKSLHITIGFEAFCCFCISNAGGLFVVRHGKQMLDHAKYISRQYKAVAAVECTVRVYGIQFERTAQRKERAIYEILKIGSAPNLTLT